MITVFGATGTTGAPLVRALLARGQQVRAVTSDPARAETLRAPGCEPAVADFADPAALRRACAGAAKVYLVTPAHRDMRTWKANAIAAARAEGVGHVVMSTGLGAAPGARMTFGAWHSESQEALKASGMAWTLLQPTYFMQNLLWQAQAIAAGGPYRDDMGGPVAWVDARDIAEVAALALTEPGHAGQAYGLTGPGALDGPAIAAILTEVTGRPVGCAPLAPAEARAGMVAAGMDPEVADAMVQLAGLAPKGHLAGTLDTVERLLGRPARSFRAFVADHRAAFAGVNAR